MRDIIKRDMTLGINKDFANIEVMELSSFGVDVRYPDDFYIPDIKKWNFIML